MPHLVLGARRALLLPLAAAALALAACADDDDPAAPLAAPGEVTVNASTGPAYLSLGDPAQAVTPADPAASTGWDLGFTATAVTVNGGQAGPGGARGYCLCQNANATTDQLRAFTAANQQATFDAVTAANIPDDAQFRADSLSPAVSGWVTGTGASAAAVAGRSFVLRTAGATSTAPATYAKVRVAAVQNATATSAGQVTLEYATQPAAGQAFGAPQTVTLDGRGGPVAVDLQTGQTGAAPAGWDLRLDGYALRVSGGVSAPGGATSALPFANPPFAAISTTIAASAPAEAYRSDTYAGVFGAAPWYRYNITGTDNQIWPTYSVYLIKRGTAVWKVQLTGYYNASAQPRYVTVRYAQLAR